MEAFYGIRLCNDKSCAMEPCVPISGLITCNVMEYFQNMEHICKKYVEPPDSQVLYFKKIFTVTGTMINTSDVYTKALSTAFILFATSRDQPQDWYKLV